MRKRAIETGDDYYFMVNRRATIGRKKREHEYDYMVNDVAGYCPYCNESIIDSFEMDHIVPMSKGGTDSHDNLAPVCKSCNRKKNNLSLLVFLATRTENDIDKYMKYVSAR